MAALGVLVTRPDNCGDVLLAGPAIRAVAASGRPTYLLSGPRGCPAADILPGLTAIVEQRLPWIDPDPMPIRRDDASELAATVRHLQVDAGWRVLLTGSEEESRLSPSVLGRNKRCWIFEARPPRSVLLAGW